MSPVECHLLDNNAASVSDLVLPLPAPRSYETFELFPQRTSLVLAAITLLTRNHAAEVSNWPQEKRRAS